MPKETIHCTEHERQRLQVRWMPEKYVDIATLRFNNPDSEIEEVDGVFVGLDRHGINKLIVALRRARDQAFGRDA